METNFHKVTTIFHWAQNAIFLCVLYSIGKQKQQRMKKINAKKTYTATHISTGSYIKLTRPGVNDRVRPKRNCFNVWIFVSISFLCSLFRHQFFQHSKYKYKILLQLIANQQIYLQRMQNLHRCDIQYVQFLLRRILHFYISLAYSISWQLNEKF